MDNEEIIKAWMKETFSFWEGAFSFIDEELPDGAWFQCHVDIADDFLSDWDDVSDGVISDPPLGIDGHDIAMAYLNECNHQ